MSTDRLDDAKVALQRGDKMLARKLLGQVLIADQRNEQAWLMLARLVETEQHVVECLEWALRINPENRSTRRTLSILKGRAADRVPVNPSRIQLIAPGVEHPAAEKPPTFLIKKASSVEIPFIPTVNGEEIKPAHHKINWALFLGALIVLLVVIIAVIGPRIAPQDPMEEHTILQLGEAWFIPPFEAFQVKGYLLGSDEFGRDLLSRILYAVRPTLTMVAVVAVVRLILGTLIGLGAGWFGGRTGRFLDALISAALLVPILLVALGAIAMLGAEIGLLAFIIGLSINGWGETARFVREQTRIVRGQLYIESAHALGASTSHILIQHTLRQIMPMVWMLFAFEISGTLMVTAGLGFLGYFIGGDLWIEVEDFVSRRTSGAPELGQMLATSWVDLLQPWPLVLTGSVIFFTILGFNLLGDGLRTRLDPEYINRSSYFALLTHRFNLWYEEHISYPTSTWFRANRLRPMIALLLIALLVGGGYLLQTRLSGLFNPSQAALSIPGGQIWASERIDPYGTGYFNKPGLNVPNVLWTFSRPTGFSGSPAISASGTVYVASLDSTLIALNPDGTTLWERSLLEIPLGSLAISPDGNIYVTNVKGGLSAYSPEGNLLWTYETEATGKANHGPIVAPDGTIYYLLEDPRGDTLFSLLPNGQLLWSAKAGTNGAGVSLRLSPDGKQIFVKNIVINAREGSRVDISLPTENSLVLEDKAVLFVGADGKTYLLAGHVVMQWEQGSQGFELLQSADWDYRALGFYQASSFPVDAGVTPAGTILLVYSGFYGSTRIVWLDPTGKYLGDSQSPLYQGTRLIAIDKEEHIILCGVGATDQGSYTTLCEALQPGTNLPLWRYNLGVENGGIVGAAMATGSLYVITGDGILTALQDAGAVSSVPTAVP